MHLDTLTIGRRIALGFTLVFVLLGAVAAIAWFALGASGRQLASFASGAKETGDAATLNSQMLQLELTVSDYLAEPGDQRAKRYAQTKAGLQQALASATASASDEGRTQMLREAETLFTAYDRAFQDVVKRTGELNSVVTDELEPSGRDIDGSLQKILAQARTNGDMNSAFKVSNGAKAYFECNGLANSFLLTSKNEYADGARASLKVVSDTAKSLRADYAELVKMDASLKDAVQEASLQKLDAAVSRYEVALEQLITLKQQRDELVKDKLYVLAPKFTASLAKVQESVAGLQASLQANIQVQRSRNENWVSIGTGAGVLLGLLAAWFIIRSISRPIRDIADLLSRESQATFDATLSVADVSQSLADGASRQAASLEESSASLHELTSMTQQNSAGAQTAKDLAAEARATADAGSRDMAAMRQAMVDIQNSSEEIAKIIKTIDEIAFQTNILALNAAVEAARAGDAGAGFAVVADEVRNLAQRSAQAARETADRIAAAMDKSTQGAQISTQVTTSLTAIVEKIRQLDEKVAAIADASAEQSTGLSQLAQAVTGMDNDTQSTAALAQQAAGSVEQLQNQTLEVKQAVTKLMVMVNGAGARSAQEAVVSPALPAPAAKAGRKVTRERSAAKPAADEGELDTFFAKT